MSDVKPRGLDNLGNTCYINCSLQCLAASKVLAARLGDTKPNGDELTQPGKLLLRKFIDLLTDMRKNPAPTINPHGFKRLLDQLLPQFRGYDQHDAQEFIAAFLDLVHEELITQPKINAVEPDVGRSQLEQQGEAALAKAAWERFKALHKHKLLGTLFGLQASKVECSMCSELSLKFEPFTVLSLPVVDPVTERPLATIEEAVMAYLKPAVLANDDRWMCPRCRTLVTARKSTVIYRLPKMLIVHLKRFSFNKVTGSFEKLSNQIAMTSDTNTEEFPRFNKKVKYTLFGVINHSGRFYGGHYSSLCSYGGKKHVRWFHIDDSCVTPLSEQMILSPASYLLFFERFRPPTKSPLGRRSSRDN